LPILAISGYSLFYVARALGVPTIFAIPMSAAYDGTTLLAAEYSLRYAQAGLSGSGPRTVVRLGALLAAFIQTLHASLGHEPNGSWALWAALPILAVVVYDIHIRWERRRALAAAGVAYPAPLPSFGFITWVLFPFSTLTSMKDIVEKRRGAVVAASLKRHIVLNAKDYDVLEPKDTAERPVLEAEEPKNNVTDFQKAAARHSGNKHSPTKHIRQWAQRQPERFGPVADRAKLPGHIVAAWEAEHDVTGTEEG
jgi:hypothetical protein